MDIQKEREAYKAALRNLENEFFFATPFDIWLAAKREAQAVPEGFVLVEKDLVQSIHQSCVNSLIAESMPAFKAVANTIIDELSPLVRVIQDEAQEPAND